MKSLKLYSSRELFSMKAHIFAALCLSVGLMHAAEPISLEWDASAGPGVGSYRVHYGTASGVYGQSANVGMATTYTVPGLSEGTTYYFAVTAMGTNQLESDVSNEIRYSVPVPNNTAPTLTSIGNQTVNEDNATGAIGITVADAESNAGNLTLSGSSSNTGLVPNGNISFGGSGANRTLTLTPAADQSGTAQISVSVSDGDLSASRTFNITVNTVNDAPTITSIADQAVAVGGVAGPVSLTVGDIESSAGSLTLSGSSSNPTLVPNGNVTFSGTGANRTVTVTPAGNQSGSSTITVSVSDGNLTANEIFTVTVGGVVANSDDTFQNLSMASAQSGIFTATFDATPSAVPIDAVIGLAQGNSTGYSELATIARFNASGNIDARDGGSYAAASTIPYIGGATYHFRMVVNVPAHTYSIYVTPPGGGELTVGTDYDFRTEQASVASLDTWSVAVGSAQPNTSITLSGLTVSGVSSQVAAPEMSPDGGTYGSAQSVTISSTTSGALIRYTTDGSTPSATAGTVYGGPVTVGSTMTLRAIAYQSGMIDSSVTTENFVINIPPPNNAVPTLDNISNVTVVQAEGEPGLNLGAMGAGTMIWAVAPGGAGQPQTVNLTGITTGGENTQTLTVSASSSNPSLVPHPTVTYSSPASTGSLRFTPATGATGSAVITVTVMDNGGGTDTVQKTFTANINGPANSAPTIASISSQSVNEDGVLGPVGFSVSDAQTAAGSLVVTASSGNTALISNSAMQVGGSGGNRNITVNPGANQSGKALVTMTVTDAQGAMANRSFWVKVNPVNDAPMLNALANVALIAGQIETIELGGIGVGPLDGFQGLTVQASSSNPSIIPNPEIVYYSPNATAELQLSPAVGANGSATITVTVKDDAGTASGGADTTTRTFTITSAAQVAASSSPAEALESVTSASLAAPQASLHIGTEDGLIVLSWDGAAGAYDLERSSGFDSQASWAKVETEPESAGGSMLKVTLTPEQPTEFFRLVRE